jgi:hypothetical protein
MYAYCLAAAHLELKHTVLRSLMVSTQMEPNGEAWPWVTTWEYNPCTADSHYPPRDAALPNLLHYAGPYESIAPWHWKFHKKHVPMDVLECAAAIPGWYSCGDKMDGKPCLHLSRTQLWARAQVMTDLSRHETHETHARLSLTGRAIMNQH